MSGLNILSKKPRKISKTQKTIILGAAAASLVASGDPVSNDFIYKSGDVSGMPTSGNDVISFGAGGGAVATGAGDDDIVGGAAIDTMMGGAGQDNMTGGGGVDNFVVIGVTNNAGYSLTDLQNVAGTGVDLSQVIDLEILNHNGVSDLQHGEIIDGGIDGALLFIFGKADLQALTVNNITKIYLDDEVLISDYDLQILKAEGLIELLGDGTIRAKFDQLDLDGIYVPPEITIQDADGNVIMPVATLTSIGSTVSVEENSTLVGKFLITDASALGTVTYLLSGADVALFDLDVTTGNLSFITAPDFENAQDNGTNNIYDITITATDEHQKSMTQDIAIEVTDIDETVPIFNPNSASSVNVIENQTSVTTITASDLTFLQYSLTGADAALFSINGSLGIIDFIAAPDFDNPQDDGLNNVYDLNVVATNFNGATTTHDLSVKVVDTPAPALYVENDLVRSGVEFTVNQQHISAQGNPSIGHLNNGNYVVTWDSYDAQSADVDVAAIKGQIFSANGQFIGSEFLVNSQYQNSQYKSSVTGLSDGGFVVAWQSGDQQSADSDRSAIKGQIFNAHGQAVGTEFLVNSDHQSTQSIPDVAALNDGGFIISWQSDDQQGLDQNGYAIKAQIFDGIGEAIGQEFQVNIEGDSNQSLTAVSVLNNGHIAVVWSSYDGQSADQESSAIKMRIFNADGVAIGGEILVNDEYANVQNTPDVTALNDGGFVITWASFDQQTADQDYAIKAKVYNADGSENGNGEFLINTEYQFSQYNPTVSAHGEEGFIITWSTNTINFNDGDTSIKARIFEGANFSFGDEFFVNSEDAGQQERPVITSLDNGGFVIAWQTDDAMQDGEFGAIKAQAYEIAPVFKLNPLNNAEFNIISQADPAHLDAALDHVTITNIPTGLTFNNGTVAGSTLTLTPADLTGLMIQPSAATGTYELDIEVVYTGSNGTFSANIPVAVSVGLNKNGNVADNVVNSTNEVDHGDGHEGSDTYVLTGNLLDYSFALKGNDIEILKIGAGSANIDLIHSYEFLQFDVGNPLDVAELDNLGEISEFSGADYDIWLTLNYEYNA